MIHRTTAKIKNLEIFASKSETFWNWFSVTRLRDLPSKITAYDPDTIIAGDFNFPEIEWKEGVGCTGGCISPSPT